MKIARKTLALIICILMILSAMPTFAATNAYKTFTQDKTFTFDNDYTIEGDLYVGNVKDGSSVTVAEDPANESNYAMKITHGGAGTGNAFVMPYFNDSTPVSGPLSLEFDFYTTNIASAFAIRARNTAGTEVNSFVFQGGTTRVNVDGSSYGSVKYEANKWYHVTYTLDFANAYLEATIKEKGTRTVQGVQVRNHPNMSSFTDGKFIRYSLGYQKTIAGDIYIDNLVQKTLTGFVVPTDNGNMYNNLSDTVWKFDGNNLGNYISAALNGNESESSANTNTVALEKVDGKTALALHQKYSGTGIQAITYMNSNVRFNTLHTSFSIKKSGGDKGHFGINLRGLDAASADKTGSLLRMSEGKLYLLWTQIGTYDVDTWYDFDIKIDLTKKYAHLEMKASADSIWKTYDMPYGNMYAPSSNTTIATVASAERIYIQWAGGTADGGDVYITDFMQNTADGLVPTLNAHNDSFDSFTTQTGNASLNSTNGWYCENFSGASATAEVTNVDGENMLKITSEANTGYAGIYKRPMYSAANVLHRIRIRMSGPTIDDSNKVILSFNDVEKDYTFDTYPVTTGGNTTNNTYVSYVVMLEREKIVIGDTEHAVTLSENKMYDVEIVYDSANKTLKAAVTTPEGVQYVNNVANEITKYIGTEEAWGNLSRVLIQNYTSGGGFVYIDDFKWDILPSTAADGVVTNENGTDNASVDEWVSVKYAETIDSSKLDAVKVTLTKGGEAFESPYTLVANGEELVVKFAELDDASAYEVTVSGVTTLLGRTPSANTLAFSTATGTISVAKPTLSENVIRTTVNSNYSHGKDGVLVVAFYNGGCLSNITYTPLNTAKGETTTEVNISSYSDYDVVKAFVLDSFLGLYPYAENFEQ